MTSILKLETLPGPDDEGTEDDAPISTISDPITPNMTNVGDERTHRENCSHPQLPA